MENEKQKEGLEQSEMFKQLNSQILFSLPEISQKAKRRGKEMK